MRIFKLKWIIALSNKLKFHTGFNLSKYYYFHDVENDVFKIYGRNYLGEMFKYLRSANDEEMFLVKKTKEGMTVHQAVDMPYNNCVIVKKHDVQNYMANFLENGKGKRSIYEIDTPEMLNEVLQNDYRFLHFINKSVDLSRETILLIEG